MRIFLTSFGITNLTEEFTYKGNPLSRAIPIITASDRFQNTFDYSLLLLFDQLVIDKKSYDKFTDKEFTSNWGYQSVREILLILNKEGYLDIQDYDSIILKNKNIINKMSNISSNDVVNWIPILKKSNKVWRQTVDLLNRYDVNKEHRNSGYNNVMIRSKIGDEGELLYEAINSPDKDKVKEYLPLLADYLTLLLSYINSNLILSNTFKCGFHDWSDMSPFYDQKFLSVGMTRKQEKQRKKKKGKRLY